MQGAAWRRRKLVQCPFGVVLLYIGREPRARAEPQAPAGRGAKSGAARARRARRRAAMLRPPAVYNTGPRRGARACGLQQAAGAARGRIWRYRENGAPSQREGARQPAGGRPRGAPAGRQLVWRSNGCGARTRARAKEAHGCAASRSVARRGPRREGSTVGCRQTAGTGPCKAPLRAGRLAGRGGPGNTAAPSDAGVTTGDVTSW